MGDPLDPATTLPLGAVVVKADERGVVEWSDGRGVGGHRRMFTDDRYVIRRRAGVYTIGNTVDEWTVVPEEKWTAEERVRSAATTWEPPTWGAPGEPPEEGDTLGFALMRALMPTTEQDLHFADDVPQWPMSYVELALVVAEWIDQTNLTATLSGLAIDTTTTEG